MDWIELAQVPRGPLLRCKANDRVQLQTQGTARISQFLFLLLCMFHSLYSVYCVCVNVYCTAANGCLPKVCCTAATGCQPKVWCTAATGCLPKVCCTDTTGWKPNCSYIIIIIIIITLRIERLLASEGVARVYVTHYLLTYLLTYSLHTAQSFLRSKPVCS
jgi:hypothetical protein